MISAVSVGQSAFAEGFEPIDIGHWSVEFRKPGGCTAFNRPFSESDVASTSDTFQKIGPVNTIGIIPTAKRGEFGLLVYFWPGIEKEIVRNGLILDFSGGEAKDLLSISDDLGSPVDHGFAGRLSAEVYAAFLSPPETGVVWVGTYSGEFWMPFDIRDVPEVLKALDTCVESLP